MVKDEKRDTTWAELDTLDEDIKTKLEVMHKLGILSLQIYYDPKSPWYASIAWPAYQETLKNECDKYPEFARLYDLYCQREYVNAATDETLKQLSEDAKRITASPVEGE